MMEIDLGTSDVTNLYMRPLLSLIRFTDSSILFAQAIQTLQSQQIP